MPEHYGLPVAAVDVPLPPVVAGVVHKHVIHTIYVAMEVAHLNAQHHCALRSGGAADTVEHDRAADDLCAHCSLCLSHVLQRHGGSGEPLCGRHDLNP